MMSGRDNIHTFSVKKIGCCTYIEYLGLMELEEKEECSTSLKVTCLLKRIEYNQGIEINKIL